MDGYVRSTLAVFVAFILGGIAVGIGQTAALEAAPLQITPDVYPTATPSPSATPLPPTATPTPGPTAMHGIEVPWEINCDDESLYNGYMNQGYCVPGWVSYESSHFRNPKGFAGAMSSYAPGVMEIVCENRGIDCSKYRGVAAVMGCGNLGNTAYVRRPGGEWYGPLLIVDCTGQKDAFVNILVKEIAIEVDYETARKLGALTIGWVEVRVNSGGVGGGYDMSLGWWWKNYMLSFVWPGMQETPTLTPVPGTATVDPLLERLEG